MALRENVVVPSPTKESTGHNNSIPAVDASIISNEKPEETVPSVYPTERVEAVFTAEDSLAESNHSQVPDAEASGAEQNGQFAHLHHFIEDEEEEKNWETNESKS